ncbi:MAG: deaminated glutathione amidase [Solirubrobacteraceae bacterium]|nr:deaminated glutathione amidase [Solirubrobacteraceae bacterium]
MTAREAKPFNRHEPWRTSGEGSGWVRIALGQLKATDDKARNLRILTGLAETAAAGGADLVVFPEEAMYSVPSGTRSLAQTAEGLDGPFVSALQGLAAGLGVTLIAGMHEKADEETHRAYNTLVAVDADGGVDSYRKLHLFDALGNRESDQVLAGEGARLTIDRDGIRLGILNCYDIRFPELARLLVDDGAEVLIVCAAWVGGRLKEDHWEVLLRARAIENTCWVAAADQSTDVCLGRSMLIDPMGVVRCSLGEEEQGIVIGEVDRARTAAVREALPSIRNRRFMVNSEVDGGLVSAGEKAA